VPLLCVAPLCFILNGLLLAQIMVRTYLKPEPGKI
jgi:hypothetical protein